MGIAAALVDQARRIRTSPGGAARVEGGSTLGEAVGPWFRCRLDMQGAPEQQGVGEGGGPLRTVPAPTLLFLPQPPGVAPSVVDRVEVASDELGTATYRVVSEPEPFRKKRKVIAWQINLERIEEHTSGASAPSVPVGLQGRRTTTRGPLQVGRP